MGLLTQKQKKVLTSGASECAYATGKQLERKGLVIVTGMERDDMHRKRATIELTDEGVRRPFISTSPESLSNQ